jgi:predicted nucleic acid-binding Zn ribbon protein
MADFVDRLGRAAGSVAERGRQWVEATRLRGELQENARQRNEALQALGEAVYEKAKRGDLPAEPLQPHLDALAHLDRRDGLLRDQIAALEAPPPGRACPVCGQALAADDRFCVGCGRAVEPPEAPTPACPACGAALKPQARFCVGCGAPVAGESGTP